ncbi:DNA circularization N-terminal domain-containing protein [Escherichia fergusonii]|uniref:DNA circularization N-terminal domain-containing protein n=1 Tax=Escherichia fergusonii TaxID=564 RepID=UPI003A94919D
MAASPQTSCFDQRDRLIEVLNKPGSGTLVHPIPVRSPTQAIRISSTPRFPGHLTLTARR